MHTADNYATIAIARAANPHSPSRLRPRPRHPSTDPQRCPRRSAPAFPAVPTGDLACCSDGGGVR